MASDCEITKVEFQDDGTNLVVTVGLRNNSDRTVHLYASPRGLRYDPNTKVLQVMLTDRDLGKEQLGGTFMLPRFTTVDPHGQAEITLKLPRFLTRIVPGQQGQPSPNLERLPIHEAAAVEVEVSWSDKPFYPDPRARESTTTRAQLRTWEKGAAVARGERRQGPPRE